MVRIFRVRGVARPQVPGKLLTKAAVACAFSVHSGRRDAARRRVATSTELRGAGFGCHLERLAIIAKDGGRNPDPSRRNDRVRPLKPWFRGIGV